MRMAAVAVLSAGVLAGCASSPSGAVFNGDMGLDSRPVTPAQPTAQPTAPATPTPNPAGQPGESGAPLTDEQKRDFPVNLDAQLTRDLGSKEAEKVMKRIGGNALTTALMFCDVARGAGYAEANRFLIEDAYAPEYYATAIVAAATAPNGICPEVKPANSSKGKRR